MVHRASVRGTREQVFGLALSPQLNTPQRATPPHRHTGTELVLTGSYNANGRLEDLDVHRLPSGSPPTALGMPQVAILGDLECTQLAVILYQPFVTGT